MASSSDEGEIVENCVEDLKATSLQHPRGSGVDRQDRHRSRLSTPDHDSASRHSNASRRSPSPRGYKRQRDDKDRERDRDRDYYAGRPRDHDSRNSRSHYDDARRPRVSYDDLDRPASRDNRNRERSRDRDGHRDRERDWYSNKRPRNRSRSPQRPRRAEKGRFDRFVREGQYDRREDSRGLQYDDDRSSRDAGSASRGTTGMQMDMALPRLPRGSLSPNQNPRRTLRNLSLSTKRLRSKDGANGVRKSSPSPVLRHHSFFTLLERLARLAQHHLRPLNSIAP